MDTYVNCNKRNRNECPQAVFISKKIGNYFFIIDLMIVSQPRGLDPHRGHWIVSGGRQIIVEVIFDFNETDF